MESNPDIFKIPYLLAMRKKTLKDRKYGEVEDNELIDFEPETRSTTIYTKTKTVSINPPNPLLTFRIYST